MIVNLFLHALSVGFALSTSVAAAAATPPLALQASYWRKLGLPERPLAGRVIPAPAPAIDYVRHDVESNGSEARPEPGIVSADFQRDVEAALNELPANVRHRTEKSVFAVLLIKHLGSSAYNETVVDESGHYAGSIVALDIDAVGRAANAWASWKESTPFRDDPKLSLTVNLEPSATDDRKHTIQYLLLHEFAHAIGAAAKVHPDWSKSPGQGGDPSEFPYSRFSWGLGPVKSEETGETSTRFKSRFDGAFAARRKVRYYRPEPKRLPARELLSVYRDLAATDFPTLYAAINPYDDFADSFANYVHVALLKRPYHVTIREAGKVAFEYEACWEQPRCREKRHYFEAFLRD